MEKEKMATVAVLSKKENGVTFFEIKNGDLSVSNHYLGQY